jgi:hypothetical protein
MVIFSNFSKLNRLLTFVSNSRLGPENDYHGLFYKEKFINIYLIRNINFEGGRK